MPDRGKVEHRLLIRQCGTTGHFASFRLAAARAHPAVMHLDQVRPCILDLRAEDVIRAHCLLRMRDDPEPNRAATSLAELRRMKEERFRDLGEKIASAGISTVELF